MINSISRTVMLGLAGCWMLATANIADGTETLPVETCVVSGMKLGSMGKPYVHEHEGRTVYFCCAGCVGRFESNPEEMLTKLDREIVKHQKKTYPLEVCVVSNEKLGSHGAVVNIVHENRLVRLCCQGCLADFERTPDKFIKKLKEAEALVATESSVRDEDDYDDY